MEISVSDSVEKLRTMVEVGRVFSVTQPRISQWKKEGMPVESDGTYDVKKITAWRLSKAGERVETLLPTVRNGGDSKDLQIVNEIVSELGRYRELVEGFKKDRGDLFAGVEAKLVSVTEDILESITQNELLAIPLKDRLKFVKDFVSSISGLYEKERLERNLSTDNVSIIVAQIKDLKKRRREEAERQASGHQNNQNSFIE
jgi:hypothetical protein